MLDYGDYASQPFINCNLKFLVRGSFSHGFKMQQHRSNAINIHNFLKRENLEDLFVFFFFYAQLFLDCCFCFLFHIILIRWVLVDL